MAKRSICDNCGAQGGLDQYGLIPETWLSVQKRYDTRHYCSQGCAVTDPKGFLVDPVVPQPVENTIEPLAEQTLPSDNVIRDQQVKESLA